MCPGSHESADTQRGGRTRKGNVWLRAQLVQAAYAAGRTKGTDLEAQDRRLAARRGKSRATVVVRHSILVIIYHVVRDGTVYEDRGPHYFVERDRQGTERRLVRQREGLGYTVSLEPRAA